MNVMSPAAPSAITFSKLVELMSGEYTASSVLGDAADAAKLGLVKMKDGNYGVPPTDAAAQSSSATLAAVAKLPKGGV